MMRWDLLNGLISRYGYRRYLEIGTRANRCFDRIRCEVKHGVDPSPKAPCDFRITSDQFFAQSLEKYDLIFIDGLHLEEQVLRDVTNALVHLADGGTIVLHDCNPPTEQHQAEAYDGHSEWNGTVWRAFVTLRMTRPELFMATVDTDWGLGVIRRGTQATLTDAELSWPWFAANRKTALNLVAADAIWNVLGEAKC